MRNLGPAIDEARALADLQGGRFNIIYSPDFISTSMPGIQKAREVAGLLQYDAMLRSQEGDLPAAWRSGEALLGARRTIGDEPDAICQFVRISIGSIALASLERTLALGEIPEPGLAKTQAVLEKEAANNVCLTIMRGQGAGMHLLFSNIENDSIDVDSAFGSLSEGTNPFGYLSRSHLEILRTLTECVAIARMPPHEWRTRLQRVEQTAKKNNTRLAYMFLPSVTKLGDACLRTQAQMNCAVAGLAAERFRLTQKRWPGSLDELVKSAFLKEVPRDPYDGKPLRSRRVKDGFVVYSLGEEGKNLGDSLDDLDNPSLPLIRYEFRLWDPEHRRQAAPPRAPVVGHP